MVPLSSHRQGHIQKIEMMRHTLWKRFQTIEFHTPPQIHGIFLTSNLGIQMWDEAMQIILDYLSTEDGRVGRLIHPPDRDFSKAVPIIYPYYSDPPPGLLGCDHFLTTLKSAHQLIYKHPIPQLTRYSLRQTVEYIR